MQLGLAALGLWSRSHLPDACAKPAFCSKTAVKLAFWPPAAQDGLRTSLLAPKTASGRASWRPRWLRTGLLPAKTVSGRASWRPRRPLDGPPDAQDGCERVSYRHRQPLDEISGSRHVRFSPVSLCLHDNSLDEASGISTWLPINFAAC